MCSKQLKPLVLFLNFFIYAVDFDSDDEEESENGTCKEALDGFGLKWDWWLRIAGTLFTLVVFAGCCCGCLMFTVTIDFCPSRVLHVMYCCILIPLFTFVFFFIWIGLGTYMVDKLYTESSDRNTHCKLGKNTTAYLGLMYCYLFALVILAVIYCIYKMAFTLGKRSRKK